VGVEEGLLPHFKSSQDEKLVAEERRLLYVAMTRARRSVVLSYCRDRFSKKVQHSAWQHSLHHYGSEKSRFITEMGGLVAQDSALQRLLDECKGETYEPEVSEQEDQDTTFTSCW